jgi:acetone carboxylase gamma subunit
MGCGRTFNSPGIFGGYPGGLAYIHNIRGADLIERARRGDAYPVSDGSFDDPALLEIGGDHEYGQDAFTTETPIASGDLYQTVMRGGSGLGDPLLRRPGAVAEDVRDAHLLPAYADSVYGVVLNEGGEPNIEATGRRREELRRARLKRSVPVREWWKAHRERILAGEISHPLRVMYAESMKLSPRWAAEYRGFWDLPEDFEFEDAETPTIQIERAKPGKITPEEAADEFLAGSEVFGAADGAATGGTLDRDTVAALLDEKLSRKEVKDLQSSYKDADRLEKWVAVLQERVSYDDPIVVPVGEGLNVVRRRAGAERPGASPDRGEGELVIRCDCGHDLCRADRNWKMDAVVYVRDTVEAMREIYPKLSHADPEWQELREFYCPSCARQLEVEASPPGYPVVHEFLPDVEGFYRGWLGREVP